MDPDEDEKCISWDFSDGSDPFEEIFDENGNLTIQNVLVRDYLLMFQISRDS